jgi:hypothetical protein
MTHRTVTEVTYPNITLKGETGHAEVQMVTRLIDDATGEQIGRDTYHRHIVGPEDDDSNEHSAVRRARATFVTPEMVALNRANLAAT